MTTNPGVEVVGASSLASSDSSAPIRETVFETDDAHLVRTRLADGATSGWHSHADRVAYGAVLKGRLRLEYGPDGATVEAGPGEFFRVPASVVHRGAAPDDEAVVSLVALVGSGDPVVEADGPPSEVPATPPAVAGEGDLVPTAELQNLVRLTPFPDAPVQQVRGHASGRVESEWHHHGDNDVFGYVIDGEGYVEWGRGEGERTLARSGECFHVPAGVVHRDVNPSEDEQDYLLWLTGSKPRIVRVEGPNERT